MHLIVVGAEPEGISLIDLAIGEGYEVTLIEPDRDKARRVLKRHDIKVLNGRISDNSILDEANASQADAIAATTSDDAINLMAMMLGREYSIQTLVTIVQNSRHRKLFEQIGAKVMNSPAEIVAKRLYEFIETEVH